MKTNLPQSEKQLPNNTLQLSASLKTSGIISPFRLIDASDCLRISLDQCCFFEISQSIYFFKYIYNLHKNWTFCLFQYNETKSHILILMQHQYNILTPTYSLGVVLSRNLPVKSRYILGQRLLHWYKNCFHSITKNIS